MLGIVLPGSKGIVMSKWDNCPYEAFIRDVCKQGNKQTDHTSWNSEREQRVDGYKAATWSFVFCGVDSQLMSK